jgi:hypothetical protein
MENKDSKEENKKEYVPPLEFSSIVFPFYTQALIKLGVIEDPSQAQEGKNLELARRLIDILDLLMDRTKGNLEPEEAKFLEACLQQLKMHYLEKAQAIKL